MIGAQDEEEEFSDDISEVRKLCPPENNLTRCNILFKAIKPKQFEKLLTDFLENSNYVPEEVQAHKLKWSFTIRFEKFTAQIDLTEVKESD